jgi:hypothetical protein
MAELQYGMSYIVVKTIKGRQYRYQQRSYRQGGKVRTEAIYLGPVSGGTRRKGVLRRIGEFIEANRTRRNGLPDEETMLKEYNARVERERQQQADVIADLHARYGLRMSSHREQQAIAVQEKAPSAEGASDVSTPTPASG